MRAIGFVFLATVLIITIFSCPAIGQGTMSQIDERIRNRIEAAGVPPQIVIGDEVIYATVALPLFYEKRAYLPAWSDEKGLLAVADSLLVTIRGVVRDGLRPEDYHLNEITRLTDRLKTTTLFTPKYTALLADIDLLLTDAFFIMGSHLIAGRVDPQSIDAEWHANLREADLSAALVRALAHNDIEGELAELRSSYGGYWRLRNSLAAYRALLTQGNWPVVPEGSGLQKGDRDARVTFIRERLARGGDFHEMAVDDSTYFDDSLEVAVKRFQGRHGLESDGRIGPMTLKAMNIGIAERIDQIRLNLERWRWLPLELGSRYVIINIANFELDVVENNTIVISMPVIVGKAYRRTPVFSDRITYIVLNPYWNVPGSIAVQDILPMVRKDPDYLSRLGMRVFRGWGSDVEEIDPATVDWAAVSAKNFPYRFRQDPGPKNLLGRVKFMFPNAFNVYLHDTPSRDLFTKHARGLSSGCIRIARPLDLLKYILQGDQRWTRKALEQALSRGSEETIRLRESLPIHILYWTAWVSPDGTVNFRDDIYNRDQRLLEALREPPPQPSPKN